MHKPTTQATTPNGAVFLDRDGTIIREVVVGALKLHRRFYRG